MIADPLKQEALDLARREAREAQYKADLAKCVKVEDLAKFYLKAGADPRYLAMRFGLALERCQAYAAALTEKRERAERS